MKKANKKTDLIKLLKSTRAKQIILGLLVVLVGVTGYFRWSTVPADNEVVPTVATVENEENIDFFAKTRMERDTKRDEVIQGLNETLKDTSLSAEALNKATEELKYNNDVKNKEVKLENLIKSKGFEDAVVLIGEEVNIILKTEEINSDIAAAIRVLVLSETDYSPEQIVLSSKK